MKNYLNFETEIKDLENELEKLKDPYNNEGSGASYSTNPESKANGDING